MLDFESVRDGKVEFDDLVAGLTKADLVNMTAEMIDTVSNLIANCTDAAVVFQPDDPEADDPYAEDEADIDLAWNLGHVIVHITASMEESAALAAELARGVKHHGRSRYETPWETATAIAQCRQRLAESRRMCLASLEMWPDEPHLENTYRARPKAPEFNAVTRYVSGLSHADSHLGQIAEIVRQSQAI